MANVNENMGMFDQITRPIPASDALYLNCVYIIVIYFRWVSQDKKIRDAISTCSQLQNIRM